MKSLTIQEAIKECDECFFLKEYTELCICATFLVTSYESECSISMLRLLKSYFRSTMGKDKMTAFIVMYIQRTVKLTFRELYQNLQEGSQKESSH